MLRRQRGPDSIGSAGTRQPRATDSARIGRWLQPRDILLDVDATTREEVLQAASEVIGRVDGSAPDRIYDALWRREQAGSTALAKGFAIPHARIPGITTPVTAFLRTATPIDFGAADGIGVTRLLVILVPTDGDHDDHLELLALVARLFSDRRFLKRLEAAKDEAAARNAFITGIERLPKP